MIFYFAIAAGFGAVVRFAFERASVRKFGERFPYGTLAANLLGSFLLGVSPVFPTTLAVFLGAFSGGFTTFGGFIGQTHARLRHFETRALAIGYLSLTVFGSLCAVALGLSLTR